MSGCRTSCTCDMQELLVVLWTTDVGIAPTCTRSVNTSPNRRSLIQRGTFRAAIDLCCGVGTLDLAAGGKERAERSSSESLFARTSLPRGFVGLSLCFTTTAQSDLLVDLGL